MIGKYLDVLVRETTEPFNYILRESFDGYPKAEDCVDTLLESWNRVVIRADTPGYPNTGLYFFAFTDPQRGRMKFAGTNTEAGTDAMEAVEKLKCKAPVLSPNQLYALVPNRAGFDHLYSVVEGLKEYLGGLEPYDFDLDAAAKLQRLENREIVCVVMGSDSSWELRTLWFDGKPFAIQQRDYRDDNLCFVTDAVTLLEVTTWLKTFCHQPEEQEVSVIDPDKPDYRLTEFGDRVLSTYYDIEKNEPIRCTVCHGYEDYPLGVGEMRNKAPYRDMCKDPFHGKYAGLNNF